MTARVAALLRALEKPGSDVRLMYFGSLVESAFPDRNQRQERLTREYFRAMRFVYEKEFVAQRAPAPAAAVAELYRTRGLSTDTAVEAGYVVSLGLQIIRSLNAERRIRRVLVIGPGLDLAPRTGLRNTPPESYQPWAVIDALLATGLARVGRARGRGRGHQPARHRPPAPRPQRAAAAPAGDRHRGKGRSQRSHRSTASTSRTSGPICRRRRRRSGPSRMKKGRFASPCEVSAALARVLRADPLDIVTERLTSAPFDLVIATNILPYFDDRQLALAASNISAMLAPGGVFLHNEARPILGDLTAALGLPFEQSRHTVIATIPGGAPLGDSVFLHVKR